MKVHKCSVSGCRNWSAKGGLCPAHRDQREHEDRSVAYDFSWRHRNALGRFIHNPTIAGG